MSSSESPQNVYARLMIRVDPSRGYPLWFPEPDSSLPEDYRHDGLRIGDVGMVAEDGSFDVLFNICLPEDHPLHQPNGVPENFKQVVLSDRDIRQFPSADGAGRVISTQSIDHRTVTAGVSGSSATVVSAGVGLSYEFRSSSTEGAILVLPEGAGKADLAKDLIFRNEALKNAESWYHYAYFNHGRSAINNDSLYLITGYHKASSWSTAAFSNAGADASLTANFTAGQVVNGNIGGAYSWQVTNSVHWRVGPEEGYNRTKRNQAISIRGYKIALREGTFATLLGNRVKVSSRLPRAKFDASRRMHFSRVIPSNRSGLDSREPSSQGASGGRNALGCLSGPAQDTVQRMYPTVVNTDDNMHSTPDALDLDQVMRPLSLHTSPFQNVKTRPKGLTHMGDEISDIHDDFSLNITFGSTSVSNPAGISGDSASSIFASDDTQGQSGSSTTTSESRPRTQDDEAEPQRISIQRLPSLSKVYHPSDVINRFLLDSEPLANVAVTHDDEWMSVFQENCPIQEDEIIEHIRARFCVEYEYNDSGSAYLHERAGPPSQAPTTSSQSSSPLFSGSFSPASFYTNTLTPPDAESPTDISPALFYTDTLTLPDAESFTGISPSPITPDDPSLFTSRGLISRRGSASSAISTAAFLEAQGKRHYSRSLSSSSSSSLSRPHPTAVQAMLEANSRRRRHPAQFTCEECGQTFTALFSLKRHRQSHSGERPYTCSIPGCGQQFFNSSDCKRHEKNQKRHKNLPNSSVLPVSEASEASEGSQKVIEPSLVNFHTNASETAIVDPAP